MKKKLALSVALIFVQSVTWSAEITVAAASSLTDAFRVITTQFEKKYPNTKVNLTFASSGMLLQQLRNGAPIDVFASADQQSMNDAEKRSLIQNATRINFASNSLVLITSSPKTIDITSLNDLLSPQIKYIAVANPAYTPAGRYAQEVLQTNNLWNTLQAKIIKTQNVRHALDYVVRGETELGFVFATDAKSQANKVITLLNLTTVKPILYPIAVTDKAGKSSEAKAFVNYVKSNEAQQVLKQYGFK